MTVGKKISRPSKPDQAGPFCFIRLEVMILQRQPSWWWLLSIRYQEVVTYDAHILVKKHANTKNDITVGKKIPSPSKPDHVGLAHFFCLEVMVLQR